MKKIALTFMILVLGVLLLPINGVSAGGSIDPSVDKKLAKNILISRFELIKNISQGKKYVEVLDEYFETHANDKDTIQDTLTKVKSAKNKLGSSLEDKQTQLLLQYMEYRAEYALLVVPETTTKINLTSPKQDEFFYNKSGTGVIVLSWNITDAQDESLLSWNLTASELFTGSISEASGYKIIPAGSSTGSYSYVYGDGGVDPGVYSAQLSLRECDEKGCSYTGALQSGKILANSNTRNFIISDTETKDPIDYKETRNKEAVEQMTSLSNRIQTEYLTSKATFMSVIGEKIQTKSKEDVEWVMGYPNYDTLRLKKADYTDAYGHEFIIVTLIQGNIYSYQILGYIEKSETQKVAVIAGNYTQKDSTYPVSLFIDPETGNAIENGDVFSVE